MAVAFETAEQAAEYLIGSTRSIGDALSTGQQEDPKFMAQFDLLACECECCNWWVPTDEIDVDGLCNECAEAEADDND